MPLRRERRAFLLLLLVCAAGSCDRDEHAHASTVRSGRGLVPTTTAAAELLSLLVGPEDLLALPEQVDAYAAQDFQSGGWEKLPRFPRYVAEPLLVLAPGMIVNHRWQSADTTAILRQQRIPVVTLESGLCYADLQSSIRQLGAALQCESRAETALAALDARVAELARRRPAGKPIRALVYSNDGTGGWAAGSRTTASTILELVGLANAAAEAKLEGHAELSFEKLLLLDPDLIVVAAPARGERGSSTRAVIESSAILAGLRARREQRIAVLPSSLMSSDSQHLVDAAEALGREVERIFPDRAEERPR